jgi:hypothetical protein
MKQAAAIELSQIKSAVGFAVSAPAALLKSRSMIAMVRLVGEVVEARL